MKNYLKSGLAGLVLAATAATGGATQIGTELALLIDGSGSIGSTNFASQQTAYANALNNVIPANYGNVAIGVWMFDGSRPGAVTNIFSTAIINDAADLAALVGAITGYTYQQGVTPLAQAIDAAAADLLNNGIDSRRQIIDVSTDGNQFPTDAGNPNVSADNAINAGIEQVNAIGIGNNVDLGWVPSDISDSFSVNADDFGASLEEALTAKITAEVTVPEGGNTLLLLGGAVCAIGMIGQVRGRRKE